MSANEARIKAAQADKLEMERDAMARELVRAEDVRYVLNDMGAAARALMDGRAERIGAEIGMDEEGVEVLRRSDEDFLRELAARIEHHAMGHCALAAGTPPEIHPLGVPGFC